MVSWPGEGQGALKGLMAGDRAVVASLKAPLHEVLQGVGSTRDHRAYLFLRKSVGVDPDTCVVEVQVVEVVEAEHPTQHVTLRLVTPKGPQGSLQFPQALPQKYHKFKAVPSDGGVKTGVPGEAHPAQGPPPWGPQTAPAAGSGTAGRDIKQ